MGAKDRGYRHAAALLAGRCLRMQAAYGEPYLVRLACAEHPDWRATADGYAAADAAWAEHLASVATPPTPTKES